MSLRTATVAAVAGVLLVIACAVGLGIAWQAHDDDRRLDQNRAEVARVAGPLVAQLFSSGTDPSDRDAARAAVTTEFAQQYAGILDAAPSAGVTIEWTPVHTGISEVSTDHVDAVVSSSVTETVPGADPTSITKVVDVRLVRIDGQWKIARADEVS